MLRRFSVIRSIKVVPQPPELNRNDLTRGYRLLVLLFSLLPTLEDGGHQNHLYGQPNQNR